MIRRWVYVVVFLLFFVYVAWRHRYGWFLFPMLEIQDNPMNHTEYFFPNGMGSWKYDPLEEQPVGNEKNDILVYFNGNAGNCSTRTPTIRVLRHLFPTFHIIHLEYPGFGISSHLSCTWPAVLQSCQEACESIRQNHRIQTLMYWGESIGAWVARHVASSVEPDWYVSLNGLHDATQFLDSHVFWALHPILKPWVDVFSETKQRMPKHTQWVFFHGREDRLVPPIQSRTKALELLESGHRSYYESLHGDHNMGILIDENQSIIREFFESHMTNDI